MEHQSAELYLFTPKDAGLSPFMAPEKLRKLAEVIRASAATEDVIVEDLEETLARWHAELVRQANEECV